MRAINGCVGALHFEFGHAIPRSGPVLENAASSRTKAVSVWFADRIGATASDRLEGCELLTLGEVAGVPLVRESFGELRSRPVVEMQRIYAEKAGVDVDIDTLRHFVRMARMNRYLTQSTAGRAGAEADTSLIAYRKQREREAKVAEAQTSARTSPR